MDIRKNTAGSAFARFPLIFRRFCGIFKETPDKNAPKTTKMEAREPNMTVIECFTYSHIDNIAASLRLKPEKVVMVGNGGEMQTPVKRYRELLKKRGQPTEITVCDMEGKDFAGICAAFHQLVQGEEACVIDLTGGDEPIIMAVGAVVAGLPPRRRATIQVQKYDHQKRVVRDCMQDNREIPSQRVELTVEELIALHGGSLHPKAVELPSGWNKQEVDRLWSLVTEDPKGWNRSISLLNEVESRSESKTHISLPLRYLRSSIRDFDEKEGRVRSLLARFQRQGIIDDHSNHDTLAYTYRSPVLRYCTLKAGNVLEVKTLLEGQAVLEEGAPLFQDHAMSVSIDWDGVIHGFAERVAETRNEIDVVLMHGTIPLFISCKNGSIGEEELYKLHTVARRFGGPYVRKMLIATDLDQKGIAANRQRAWDMDILLVTDAAELSQEEWQRIFRQAVQ